jgi:hypothetical protein
MRRQQLCYQPSTGQVGRPASARIQRGHYRLGARVRDADVNSGIMREPLGSGTPATFVNVYRVGVRSVSDEPLVPMCI